MSLGSFPENTIKTRHNNVKKVGGEKRCFDWTFDWRSTHITFANSGNIQLWILTGDFQSGPYVKYPCDASDDIM